MSKAVWLASILGACCVLGCNTSQAVEIKKVEGPPPMPSFNFNDLAGKPWGPTQFKNKTVLIEFWATWCGPCREIAPDLAPFVKRNKERVQFLSVSLDEKEDLVRSYIDKHPTSHPVIHGGPSLAKTWNLSVIPTLVLIRNGHVLLTWSGKDQILNALTSLEKEIL